MAKKRSYQKPQVKAVKMIPKEAFLGQVCKAASGSVAQPGRCRSQSGCGNNIIGS